MAATLTIGAGANHYASDQASYQGEASHLAYLSQLNQFLTDASSEVWSIDATDTQITATAQDSGQTFQIVIDGVVLALNPPTTTITGGLDAVLQAITGQASHFEITADGNTILTADASADNWTFTTPKLGGGSVTTTVTGFNLPVSFVGTNGIEPLLTGNYTGQNFSIERVTVTDGASPIAILNFQNGPSDPQNGAPNPDIFNWFTSTGTPLETLFLHGNLSNSAGQGAFPANITLDDLFPVVGQLSLTDLLPLIASTVTSYTLTDIGSGQTIATLSGLGTGVTPGPNSATYLASLGGGTVDASATNAGIEIGFGAGNGFLQIGGADLQLYPGGRDPATVIGGTGYDVAKFSFAKSNYTITRIAGGVTVAPILADQNGAPLITLKNFEELDFADSLVVKIGRPPGDFNGDGISDILWRTNTGSVVGWEISNGSLLTSVTLATPPAGLSLAASGDFDGDGKADVLWQDATGHASVSLIIGSAPTPTLTNPQDVGNDPGAGWHVKATGDFDGDSKSDILWQNDSGQAGISLMNGATSTAFALAGFNPGADWHVMGAGDFNGDGKSDILWQNDNGQAAIWLMSGTTVASFGVAGFNPGSDWHVIGAGDFNGDGDSDILWQNTNGQAAIWLMNGTSVASFGVAGFNPGSDWHVRGTADFNGDGKADILWQNNNGQTAIWLMNGLTPTTITLIGTSPGSGWQVLGVPNPTSTSVSVTKAWHDFDGDGKSDILWQNSNGLPAVWLLNGTAPTITSAVGFNPGNDWHAIGAGDFDGNGKSDILWQNNNGQAAIWLMNGTTVSTVATAGFNPGSDWHAIGSGDFDGDGKSDILWQNNNGQAAIWLMNGSTPTTVALAGFNPGSDWHIKGVGDFDGDGKSDILWQNNNGQAAIWLMNGTTVSSFSTVGFNPGTDWHVEAAGDFNGDGKADILWQNANGQAAIWLMNGLTPTTTTVVGFNPGTDWHVKGAYDFDGDGKADILWQNDNGQAAIWLMNGTTVSSVGTTGFNPGPDWHIVATPGV